MFLIQDIGPYADNVDGEDQNGSQDLEPEIPQRSRTKKQPTASVKTTGKRRTAQADSLIAPYVKLIPISDENHHGHIAPMINEDYDMQDVTTSDYIEDPKMVRGSILHVCIVIILMYHSALCLLSGRRVLHMEVYCKGLQ